MGCMRTWAEELSFRAVKITCIPEPISAVTPWSRPCHSSYLGVHLIYQQNGSNIFDTRIFALAYLWPVSPTPISPIESPTLPRPFFLDRPSPPHRCEEPPSIVRKCAHTRGRDRTIPAIDDSVCGRHRGLCRSHVRSH
jgi:hypothetical protein